MKILSSALMAGACLCALAAPGYAADLPTRKTEPQPPPVVAPTFQPWQIRLRGVGLVPQGSGTIDQLPGHKVTVGNSIIPEVDLSYYFTPNWAVEAICCLSRNSIYVSGLAGASAQTWVFPPTVTGQYHFTNFGAFQPYLGVGVNFTDYFDTQTRNSLAGTSMHINPSWGVAGQVGFDYMIDSHWGFNVDVKRILMEPTWHVNETPFTTLTGRANINPWLFGVGITYRFGGPDAGVVARY
jgi:outer membrane protein